MPQPLQPLETNHTYRHHTPPPHHTSVTTTNHPFTTYTSLENSPTTDTFSCRKRTKHGTTPHHHASPPPHIVVTHITTAAAASPPLNGSYHRNTDPSPPKTTKHITKSELPQRNEPQRNDLQLARAPTIVPWWWSDANRSKGSSKSATNVEVSSLLRDENMLLCD